MLGLRLTQDTEKEQNAVSPMKRWENDLYNV